MKQNMPVYKKPYIYCIIKKAEQQKCNKLS